MSTKETLKEQWEADARRGFRLYTDLIEEFAGDDAVYLELQGFAFEADSGGRVRITLPRAWAERLGLVPPAGQASGSP